MKRLNNNDLVLIIGGGITGAIINSLISAGKFIYSLGQSLGSAIRRISEGKVCPIR